MFSVAVPVSSLSLFPKTLLGGLVERCELPPRVWVKSYFVHCQSENHFWRYSSHKLVKWYFADFATNSWTQSTLIALSSGIFGQFLATVGTIWRSDNTVVTPCSRDSCVWRLFKPILPVPSVSDLFVCVTFFFRDYRPGGRAGDGSASSRSASIPCRSTSAIICQKLQHPHLSPDANDTGHRNCQCTGNLIQIKRINIVPAIH